MQHSRFRGWIAASAAGLILVGCATGPVATDSRDAATAPAIVLQPWEELNGEACKVGFNLMYPTDLPEQVRELSQRIGTEISPGIPKDALREQGGSLPLPRPNRDPRVDRSDPETHVFPVTLMTFSHCQTTILDEPAIATVEFIVGECVQGPCAPVRVELPQTPTVARFRVVDSTGTGP